MSAFSPSGSGGIPAPIVIDGLTSPPTLQDVNIVAPNTEQTISLPANVRKYELFVLSTAKLQVAHVSGQSGLVFIEMPRGTYLADDNITAGTVTLYVQSPATGVVARLRYWT
jgi:hypothetical protein